MEPLTEPQLATLKASLVSLGRECVASCDSETERLRSTMGTPGRTDGDHRSEEARILLEAYKDLLLQLVRLIQRAGGTFANTGQLFPAVAQSVANQLTGPRRPRLYRFRGPDSFQEYTDSNAWVSDLEHKLLLAREEVENEFRSGRAF